MTPAEIKQIRQKLGLDAKIFAELFGLSNPSSVNDIENGSLHPSGIIITMLTLLDTMLATDAQDLVEKMLTASRKSNS